MVIEEGVLSPGILEPLHQVVVEPQDVKLVFVEHFQAINAAIDLVIGADDRPPQPGQAMALLRQAWVAMDKDMRPIIRRREQTMGVDAWITGAILYALSTGWVIALDEHKQAIAGFKLLFPDQAIEEIEATLTGLTPKSCDALRHAFDVYMVQGGGQLIMQALAERRSRYVGHDADPPSLNDVLQIPMSKAIRAASHVNGALKTGNPVAGHVAEELISGGPQKRLEQALRATEVAWDSASGWRDVRAFVYVLGNEVIVMRGGRRSRIMLLDLAPPWAADVQAQMLAAVGAQLVGHDVIAPNAEGFVPAGLGPGVGVL